MGMPSACVLRKSMACWRNNCGNRVARELEQEMLSAEGQGMAAIVFVSHGKEFEFVSVNDRHSG